LDAARTLQVSRGLVEGAALNLIARIPELKLAIRKHTIGFRVPDAPHMDSEGAAEFERSLKASTYYLEFGSGGSTVMAARLGKPGVSIEGDPYYLRDVRRKVRTIPNKLKLIHVDIGRTEEWGYPRDRRPTEENVAKWAEYVATPFRKLDGRFFDLVLIDGRFRAACALTTISEARKRDAKVRILLDDYNDPEDPRPHYKVIEQYAPLTRLAGRMAVFDIGPGMPGSTPDEAALRASIADCR
jgi:hypothetical protein